jgi:hypothetical protein
VASTLGTQIGHLWHRPIVQHEVDVTVADSGCIQSDQDIGRSLGSCQPQSMQLSITSVWYIPGSGVGTS